MIGGVDNGIVEFTAREDGVGGAVDDGRDAKDSVDKGTALPNLDGLACRALQCHGAVADLQDDVERILTAAEIICRDRAGADIESVADAEAGDEIVAVARGVIDNRGVAAVEINCIVARAAFDGHIGSRVLDEIGTGTGVDENTRALIDNGIIIRAALDRRALGLIDDGILADAAEQKCRAPFKDVVNAIVARACIDSRAFAADGFDGAVTERAFLRAVKNGIITVAAVDVRKFAEILNGIIAGPGKYGRARAFISDGVDIRAALDRH